MPRFRAMAIAGRALHRADVAGGAEGRALFCGLPLPPMPTSAASLARAAGWLRSVPLDWARIGAAIAFAPDGYARHTLAIEDGWEIALCCWLPGQGSLLHDHGLSVGIVRLLAGSLTETRYRPVECRLIEEPPRTFVAGETMCEERDAFHQVSVAGPGPAISLHLYNPPLLRSVVRH